MNLNKIHSKFLAAGIFLFLVFVSGLCYGDVYSYTLDAGAFDIVVADGNFKEIDMVGFGQLLAPGKPKLPSKVFQIALPPGVMVESVSFEKIGEVELAEVVDIAPAPMVSVMSATSQQLKAVEAEYKATIETAYSMSEAYPGETGVFVATGGYRKYNLIHIRFSPMSYIASTKKLIFCPQLKVNVNLMTSAGAEEDSELLLDNVAEAEERASNMLVNYSQAQSWYPTIAGDDPIATTGGFVIITTNALESSVWPLANWQTCKGRDVHIKTVEDISSSYSGADLAEKIRNFLRAYLSSWSITKVCLIGDITDVPMRDTHPSGPDGPDEGTTPWQTADKVPTDFYYAELTWTDASSWNSNSDSMYGQQGVDNVQFPSEVDVGRIPWSDPTTVEDICMNMVEFEWSQDMDNYKLNYLLTAAYFWPDTDNAALKTYILNNACDPGDPPIRIYEQGPCWNSSYYSNYTMTRDATRDVWGAGHYGFVNLAGHGSSYGVYFQERHPTCYAQLYFHANDRSYLDPDYPSVVFSCACSTAWPEVQNLGKSLLERGSVGFVGATRLGFGTHGWDDPSDGSSQSLDWKFCDYAIDLGGGRSSVGWSHQHALQYMYNDHNWSNSWYQMFEWNLYSNPDLWIRERPTSLPNLTDITPTGWTYPIVPRSNGSATSTSCPLTSTLTGNTSSTYWNFAWTNNGVYKAPGNVTRLYLDDVYIRWASVSYTPVDYEVKFNNQGPSTVRGGRHTVYYELDVDEKVWESNEFDSDNRWAHQFVWSPYALGDNVPVSRSAPPKRNSWGYSYYNNDGFSFLVQSEHPDKWWSAVGIVPSGSTSDYDMRLWDIGDYTGSETGFGGGYLEYSSWTSGASNFVIVNDNQAMAGTYYAGVINANEGTGSYRIEEDTSTKIYEGINGPYYKNTTNVLDIYECYLNAGTYGFKLEQIGGDCDYGISLYDDETMYCSKSEYMSGAYSNSGGDGADEFFSVTIADSGYHALVVWKSDSSDYSKSSGYKIRYGKCAIPGAASDPYPINGATGVGNNTDLAWSPSTDTDHYEVLLREGADPFVLMGETDVNSFSLDPLVYDVTYTWVIRSYNICGRYTDSPWWTFTTVLEPSITVTTPNGGELWYIGQAKSIKWTSQAITGNVRIDISRNSGVTWSTITSNTADDGTYTWPAVTGPASALCRVKVTSLVYPSASDMTNSKFEIAEPYITVLQPNGGEVWYSPDSEYIYWDSGGAEKYVAIDISRDGGSSWDSVTASTLNDGEFLWQVTGPGSKRCLVRISDALVSDTSDSLFMIFERSITVTSPDGGEIWRIGKPGIITWGSDNITGNVMIEMSRNGGGGWSTVTANTTNDGHYSSIAAEPASANCLVRVSSLDYPAVADDSDSLFICTYLSDINLDLMVQGYDLGELAYQWLQSDDPGDCSLTAELFGNNCKVDFEDYAVMASEWLNGTP
ncbi:MAG: hypothetical protein KAS96_08100 [Planctomycetes bacterium]|nr:hypothetical protein [Planctomycetota bacterium]